jgi:hypothetical protein
MAEHVHLSATEGAHSMRGLAIGIALTVIFVLVPGGHLLLVLLIPLAFFAFLRYRTTWQPLSRTYRPGSHRARGSDGAAGVR